MTGREVMKSPRVEMDFFQQESLRLRTLAESDPNPERLAEVRQALASKYQGIQHLAASALAAWTRRARQSPARARRLANGRKPRPGPETEWIELLRRWVLSVPLTWWQSFSHAARLVASFVGPEDADWVIDLYLIFGRPFDVAVARLPDDTCVARLKEVAISGSTPSERHLAEFALRYFQFDGKVQFHAERRANDPDPRDVARPGPAQHDRRNGLARRRRW